MKKPIEVPAPHHHFRDATGHVEEEYAAELQALGKANAEPPDLEAFSDAELRRDSLAEELGEEFVRTATSGESDAADLLDEDPVEALGGPFVNSTSARELAYDLDASNPEDATREPFPRTSLAP
jgi:hypothetical protein